MPLPPDDLDALVRRREAEARAAVAAEGERILALPGHEARCRAYAALLRRLDDGEALPPDLEVRIARSLAAENAADEHQGTSGSAATTWEAERRRHVVMFFARQYAPIVFVALAVAPFAVAALRWGLGLWEALGTFLDPGWPLVGVALALAMAGVLGRLADRAETMEGLASLAVGAFGAGVVGMALGRVF